LPPSRRIIAAAPQFGHTLPLVATVLSSTVLRVCGIAGMSTERIAQPSSSHHGSIARSARPSGQKEKR